MVKNIIFDLGNVLLDVHYEKFREKICSHNISKEKYESFFLDGNYRLLGYEAGLITTDEFITKCVDGLNLEMTSIEFASAFNDMFTEITPMKEMLIRLKEESKYRLFLLSNTSPLHFKYARERFGYINLIEKFGLSYELKSLKPESDIYKKAISYFDVQTGDCLFIDDLYENCAAGEKLGLRTIVYDKNNHNRFVKDFEEAINS